MRTLLSAAFTVCLVAIAGIGQQSFAQGRVATAPIDSIKAVRSAESALYRADTSEHRPLVVSEFRRDSLGVVIDLSPAPKKGIFVLGGGARVRVFTSGKTKILAFFQ